MSASPDPDTNSGSMSAVIRVLVVDDHAILRDGIRSLLERQEDITVVGEASNGIEALQKVDLLLPDIVLMDIAMPEMNGLDATRLIKEGYPQVRVLILTQHDNREYIAPLLQAGASGYVLKSSGGREVANAIRQVYEHGAFLEASITQTILQEYTHKVTSPQETGALQTDQQTVVSLTERERQILELVVSGKTNKEIGYQLGISPKTVSVHRTNIMSKLGVQNSVELIRYAVRHRLINIIE